MDCLSRVKTLPSYGRSFNFPHFFFDTSFNSSTKSHQFFQRPEKDTQIEEMQAKITALEEMVAQLMTAFTEGLPARLSALETWKASVQSGQDAVLIKYVPSETD